MVIVMIGKAEKDRPAVLSISRRSDIPAFHLDWLLRGIERGFVEVPNPHRPSLSRRVSLLEKDVAAAVLWSKNPAPLLAGLERIRGWCPRLLVQFTLNDYPPELEPGVAPLEDRLRTFEKLSAALGAEAVIWRYDPIVLSTLTDWDCHRRAFASLCRRLSGRTRRVMVSLADYYRKVDRRLRAIEDTGVVFFREAEGDPRTRELLSEISVLARGQDMEIFTCAEPRDWSDCGIRPGACIDSELLSRLFGVAPAGKDPAQRSACRCMASIDIGSYSTCRHGCPYCYAS